MPAAPISTSPTGGTSARSQMALSVEPRGSPSFATIFPFVRTCRTDGFSTASDIAISATKKSGVARMQRRQGEPWAPSAAASQPAGLDDPCKELARPFLARGRKDLFRRTFLEDHAAVEEV